jgi:hypothetical protein
VADAHDIEKKSGLTRGKAILIAVLAVVLVVVLYVQFGSSGSREANASSTTVEYRPPGPPPSAKTATTPTATPSTAPAATPVVAANAKTPLPKETATVPIIDETRWKSPKLTSVIAYDPFAIPPSFPQPGKNAGGSKEAGSEALIQEAAANEAKRLAEAIEKLRLQLKELEARGVHVIIREGDQYAAMIGDRMLHVGDEINGFTVTAIDSNGVHVERKQSP